MAPKKNPLATIKPKELVAKWKNLTWRVGACRGGGGGQGLIERRILIEDLQYMFYWAMKVFLIIFILNLDPENI